MNSSYKEDCVAVVCHEEKISVAREACKKCPNIRHIISFGQEEGVLSFHKLLKDDGKAIPNVQINYWDDTVVIPYSSGTTGLPKGVVLTHGNLLANLAQSTLPEACHIKDAIHGEQEILLGLLPMYHIYGFAVSISRSLYLGCKLLVLKEFKQHTFVDCVEKFKPTCLPLVPPLIGFLENSSLVKPSTLDSVHTIYCGAAPLGQSMVDQFFEKFGPKIHVAEGYGMTETSPVITMTPKGRFTVGSCGVLLPNTEAKLVDPNTEEIVNPFENEGELRVRGPQVMKCYLKNEKATRETIKDGWLCTGDIAKVDKNENIYVIDRIKELIKVKGLQVAPAELENILINHPDIEDVAVIGIPDERSGEVPKAFVVRTKESKNLNEKEVKEFVAKIVAPHKQLASVSFIDEIPKSTSGKILRKDLRKL
ncbi:4-coumarate--CoA ligase 1 [Armadillidium nasatum]|uniref:4-coumarate--CoA ligase 1 n=1 Tax=Armadillidium nasatum TaxID=96803 RepID=A0A5N5TK16_9CRUS|nr:4-coumarate--CoA ligase 1 [Armadillidium nasatum]